MTPEDETILNERIAIARQRSAGSPIPPTTAVDLDRTKGLPPDLDSDCYYGLPSNPISIYHTGKPWPKPTGPESQRVPKEARPISIHPIAHVWRVLGRQIYEYFDSIDIKWTSIDPVRFAEVGSKDAGPLFIWVGVMPKTLSRKDAENAAIRCKQILARFQITSVEIAFRESIFTRFAGPQLLNYEPAGDPITAVNNDPTADLRIPFTPVLGIQIAPRNFPHFQGTGGLYLRKGGKHNRVLLLTARHVVLPLSEHRNELYSRINKSSPRHEVLLLGSKAYQDAVTSITDKIEDELIMVDHYKNVLRHLGGDADTLEKLVKAERTIETLKKFHSEITSFWSTQDQRVLGRILYSPPISLGTGDKSFTEDWAVVELYRKKINWNKFRGNVMYLGKFRSRQVSCLV